MTTDNLPPLPEPDWTETRPTNPPRHGQHWYGEAKMQAYARAAILAERERCAKVCKEWASICDSGRRHGAKVGAQECAKLIQSQDDTEDES